MSSNPDLFLTGFSSLSFAPLQLTEICDSDNQIGMEDSELKKVWYVTHEGQQFGPVTMEDLKYEADRGELNPRLDMVWNKNMEDWIPSGQIKGIFEKNSETEVAAVPKVEIEPETVVETRTATPAEITATQVTETTTAVSQFEAEETTENATLIDGKCGGTSRGGFIFICYVFPFLWFFGIVFLAKYLEGKVTPGILGMSMLVATIVPVILAIIVIFRRFKNLGMSIAWFFGLLIPILNVWLGFRLFACPEDYAAHKKLDGIGWFLAILYWLPIVVAVLATVFSVVVLTQSDPTDPYREMIENFIQKIQEFKPLAK